MNKAWSGKWLNRAWLGPKRGWIGNSTIYVPQNGWAMFGDVFQKNHELSEIIVENLKTICRPRMPTGFQYKCKEESTGENGMWPALNHPLVLGLLKINQTTLAWEEWIRNSMNWQATVAPKIWPGIWTSADEVLSNNHPGLWTVNFPALCMHRHSWPLFSLQYLVGFEFTHDGLIIRPSLPSKIGRFHYRTHLCSLEWDGIDKWWGHYSPSVAASYKITFDFKSFDHLHVPLTIHIGARDNKGDLVETTHRSDTSYINFMTTVTSSIQFTIFRRS